MPTSPARDSNADGPYNLLCSSLPGEPQRPIHAETSGSTSGELRRQAESTPQDASYEAGMEQLAPGATPQSPSYITSMPGKIPPVSELPGRMTAQELADGRHTIPREGSFDIDRTYSHPKMTPENAASGLVPAYATDYTGQANGIPDWEVFLHPQGTMYFHRKEKNVVTNVNIFNKNDLKHVEGIIEQVFPKIDHVTNIPDDKQLVIGMRRGGQGLGYYFASLKKRCLFWFDDCTLDLSESYPNPRSYTHIELDQGIGMNYNTGKPSYLDTICLQNDHIPGRCHYRQFPHAQTSSCQLIEEIKGLLAFLAAEQVFNDMTTMSWNAEEINTMTSIINSIPNEAIKSDTCVGAAYYRCAVGKFMFSHAFDKFINCYGLPNARYRRDQDLFDDAHLQSRSRMIITSLFSPALFYTPTEYLRSLEAITSEKIFFFEAWRRFVKELHKEWNNLAIFATVLLATNMAFLAIPGVVNGDHPEKRSAAQICSYFSTVLSIGSVALGQLFSRYHRIKGWENLDERIWNNYSFLHDIGCSRLAIIYSFPYATLCWSVIAFLVAFLIMCFDGTTILVRCLIGITSAILVLAVVYCIYTMHNEWSAKLLPWFTRFMRFILFILFILFMPFMPFMLFMPFMRKRFSHRASTPHTNSDPVELQNHPRSRPSFGSSAA